MRSAFLALLLLALTVPSVAQTRPRRAPERTPSAAQQSKREFEEDQKAIAELQEREIRASMAFDIDELLSLWTDDGVLLPPDHAPVKGRNALRQYYEEQKQRLGNNDILGYDENWEEVQISGDLGYQWGTISVRLKPPLGSNEIDATVHALRVLKRQADGSWLVARAIWNNAAAPEPQKPAAEVPNEQ